MAHAGVDLSQVPRVAAMQACTTFGSPCSQLILGNIPIQLPAAEVHADLCPSALPAPFLCVQATDAKHAVELAQAPRDLPGVPQPLRDLCGRAGGVFHPAALVGATDKVAQPGGVQVGVACTRHMTEAARAG